MELVLHNNDMTSLLGHAHGSHALHQGEILLLRFLFLFFLVFKVLAI
jgi:hypothetical protein